MNMILNTRMYLQSSFSQMGSLTECFQKIAEGYTARRGALFSDSDILSGDSTSPGLISTSSGNLLTRTSAHRERGGVRDVGRKGK